jgi:hypothetical protein
MVAAMVLPPMMSELVTCGSIMVGTRDVFRFVWLTGKRVAIKAGAGSWDRIGDGGGEALQASRADRWRIVDGGRLENPRYWVKP